MFDTTIRKADPALFPQCVKCKKPVESVSWEKYYDEIPLGVYGFHYEPNGCGHIDVTCHGETWRTKFFPHGYGKPELRAREGSTWQQN
ncbi:hypothetical protein [Burkholderia ambifaria]|uniref:hypothetical protein n=1 Tax=Burkholderia ambifaria TaxID=152480 RepID=UPI00158B12CF|nr:hypothetical protein [Burkholderia ambifaria]MBR8344670.1 hypothetical protein [Burkholderia ambifaria]